jgi:hypothetical protein
MVRGLTGGQTVPRKPRETTHLRVRVELPLLARLEKSREKRRRTLTGEITERLEQSFAREGQRDLVGQFVTTLESLFTRLGQGVVQLHDEIKQLQLVLMDRLDKLESAIKEGESRNREQGDPITRAVRSLIESVDKLYGRRGWTNSLEQLELDSLESLSQKFNSINESLQSVSRLVSEVEPEGDGEQK